MRLCCCRDEAAAGEWRREGARWKNKKRARERERSNNSSKVSEWGWIFLRWRRRRLSLLLPAWAATTAREPTKASRGGQAAAGALAFSPGLAPLLASAASFSLSPPPPLVGLALSATEGVRSGALCMFRGDSSPTPRARPPTLPPPLGRKGREGSPSRGIANLCQ